MSTVLVGTSAALLAAVRAAQPGDTISLTSGTYDNVVLKGITAPNITITSANPSRPAVVTGLSINGSSGITIANIDLYAKTVAAFGSTFSVSGSSNITFDHVTVHGPAGEVSANAVSPFLIRNSTNVSVTNSEFHDLWHGINLLDTTGVTVSGNSFHDIRTDGVRGGGNSNLNVSSNVFTNFTPATGDHADAIQLWTTNTSAAAHDIVISSNVVVRGSGDPIQGVFIRDEVGTLPFERVAISNNIIVGSLYNGIALDHAVNSSVTNNSVIGEPDQRSWISASGVGTVVSDNVATFYRGTGATATGALAGNTLTVSALDNGATVIHDWLAAHGAFDGAWGSASDVLKTLGLHYSEASRHAIPTHQLVAGTDGNDTLKAVINFDSRLEGGAGNDMLTGSATHTNLLVGGVGDDIYTIKGGGDIVVEDANGGTDTVYTSIDYTLAANVETLRLSVAGLTGTGNALDNRIVGTAGIDHMYGMGGDDLVQGLAGNDDLHGGDGHDDLRGDDGNDMLWGDAGNDTLLGGDGVDLLNGGDGNDILEGGAGADTMVGGAGADIFRFRTSDIATFSVDHISDFQVGVDRIDLRLIDANTKTAKDDAFTFIGTSAFHNIAGELRYSVAGSDATVSGDINGDGIADFSMVVHWMPAMNAVDFYL